MHAEILAIGDEITSGQLLDTNSQWLSQRLSELGIRVLYHAAVGDSLDPLTEVFRQAFERSDIVISTGGLGATADDLTREAVARAAGRSLMRDERALAHIRQLFARRKRPMPERNEVQALLPEGSQVVPNPDGTAPGIDLNVPRSDGTSCRVFCLPGVPAEMRQMWSGTVANALRKAGAGGRVIVHRKINCFGVGETQIEAMLPDLIRRGRVPSVGINASNATIVLRITAEGTSEREAYVATEATAETIRECLGSLVFGEGEEGLEHAVVRLLREHRQTLATAEWGTAGLVADWLGGVADAPGCYRGGLIVADTTTLRGTLQMPETLLANRAPADREVVEAMAAGCRARFGTDFGLAVGPFPEIDSGAAEPPPYAIAVASNKGIRGKVIPYAGHPALLKILAAKHALNLARLAMLRAE